MMKTTWAVVTALTIATGGGRCGGNNMRSGQIGQITGRVVPSEAGEGEFTSAIPVGPERGTFDLITGQIAGRTIEIPPSTNLDAPINILEARSTDPLNSFFSVSIWVRGVKPPDLPSATLGFPIPPGGGAPRAAYAGMLSGTHAIIQWGAGEVLYETVVDITRGQVFTVGGSFIRISATNNLVNGAGAPISAVFAAFLSLLPKGSQRHSANYTNDIGAIAAAGNVESFAPPFSKTIKIYRAPANAPFTLQFVPTGPLVILHEISVAAGVDCPEIPIPDTAFSFRVLNGAVPITHAAAFFSLDL